MGINVDTDGLAGTGSTLANTLAQLAPVTVNAPASDPTSIAAATIVTAHAANVAAEVARSDQQRVVGGQTVTHTAASFVHADEDSAALFGQSTAASPLGAPTGQGPDVVAAVPIPALPTTPTVPGEVFARQLHGGAGSTGLRDAAIRFGSEATTLSRLADDTDASATAIATQWYDDGQHQAATNTAANAAWLRHTAGRYQALADAATSLADHHDTAVTATPTIAQFDAAHTALRTAAASGDLPGFVQAQQQLAGLNAAASETAALHHTSTTETTTRLAGFHSGSPDISLHGPNTPLPQTPADDEREIFEFDIDDIYRTEPGALSPWGYQQIAPGVWVPDPASNALRSGFIARGDAEHPLDLDDVIFVGEGSLPRYGYIEIVPGMYAPDPGAPGFVQREPENPLDLSDIVVTAPGTMMPIGYREISPGVFIPWP